MILILGMPFKFGLQYFGDPEDANNTALKSSLLRLQGITISSTMSRLALAYNYYIFRCWRQYLSLLVG